MLTHSHRKLFFIIAPDRSGTSKLQEIMNTFSGFCNTEESRIAGADSPSCWVPVMRHKDFSYLENFLEKNWSSEFFVEKSPPSINCLSHIHERFPDANFIFLQRDPLKIILSQLNLFYGMSQIGNRKHDLGNLIMRFSTVLNRERVMAKRLLKMIYYQAIYKPRFSYSVTIRYEDLINSLESQLALMEERFGIKASIKKARDSLSRPSYSTSFRYGIKELSDKMAVDMVRVGRKLWGYENTSSENAERSEQVKWRS